MALVEKCKALWKFALVFGGFLGFLSFAIFPLRVKLKK
jgi:hypothetical protein